MKNKTYPNEYLILGIILLLSGYGMIMMYSASSIYAMNIFDNYMFFLNQQFKWLFLGLILMYITSKLNYNLLNKYSRILLMMSWLIIILGYFFKGNNYAARWLIIGGKSLMTTSDFARISLIIFTSSFIQNNYKKINDWKFVSINYLPFLIITLMLILFQPDTSTTFTIALIIMLLLFISKTSWKFLLGISLTGIFFLIIKILTTPYALNRIINWNDDQKIQSLNAFGTGGLFGRGLGNSIIKNGYLPQSHTDFILPIIGEELGFFGITIIFFLFGFLYKKSMIIVKQAPDLFSMFLAIGIISSIMIYFLINAAYTIGLVPTTGLPIPFISYGGSHTIFTFISIGILLNISSIKKNSQHTYYRGIKFEF